MTLYILYILLGFSVLGFSDQLDKKNIDEISSNPNESFHELTKLKNYAWLHSDASQNNNQEAYRKYVIEAEKRGIFKIFQNANRKKQKTHPQLRRKDGFIQEYTWIIMAVQKSAPLYWYKIIHLLENGQENEAISYLEDFINAELLLSTPTMRTIKFINMIQQKYHFSETNKNYLTKMKNDIAMEIRKIQENKNLSY